MRLIQVKDSERLIKAAHLVGGDALRLIAEFYVTGEYPPLYLSANHFLQTVCKQMTSTLEDRAAMTEFIAASACGELDAWATRHTSTRGAKKIAAMRVLDRDGFNHMIRDAVSAAPTLVEAAKNLGISYRSMMRYVKEAGSTEGVPDENK